MTAADTTAEHAKACAGTGRSRTAASHNAGPFTPWRYRAEGAPPESTLVFPGGLGGANWGGTAFDRRSGYRLRGDPGRRRARLDREGEGRLAGSLRQEHAGASARPRQLRCPHRRCELAVPETAMGPPDRDQCVDRRHRLADAARHHRTTSRGQAEHRTARAGRSDRDRRRGVVHRVDRRQPVPRARREDRQASCG